MSSTVRAGAVFRGVAAFSALASTTVSAQAPDDATTPADVIIVTASRTSESLRRSAAAVTVIDTAQIAMTPADDYGDLLRAVPGMNVAQASARDVSLTARGATSTLANSQLVMLDGRSAYLDFFGFVAWDLLPIQSQEIERIEVVRGPGSAVWGANAMSGVVHVISKRPKDLVGTTLYVGTADSAVLHARAVGNIAYKISAGRYDQSAYPRPTGLIPGVSPPQAYPAFANGGTDQNRFSAEVDWDLAQRGVLTFGAGHAETSGILHSGIGPFDVRDESALAHVKVDWRYNAWSIGVSTNKLDGDAVNLLTRRGDGAPLPFAFETDTLDFHAVNNSMLGRHNLTYGLDYRSNDFLLEIAPAAGDRDEWGLFLQDEIALGERWRWSLGARHFEADALRDPAFVPRTSFVFTPGANQAVRFSYGRSFRSPSAINEYLDVTILQPVGPLAVPADADGNPAIDEERMAAYELGYTHVWPNGMALTVDLYRNEITDSIDFFVADRYRTGNLPAPGPTLPATVVPCFNFAPGTGPAACPLGGLAGVVPSDYSYRNVGRTVQRGAELALTGTRGAWRWFANASWQDDPQIEGVEIADINVPPSWRANLGLGRDGGRFFWSTAVNYQDEAYWADVLAVRASTEAFAQVGATVGWRFIDERVTLKIVGQNVLDERVQQHIFGDLLERRVEGQVSVRLGR
jgi:iron complex outermembrane receptor protein